MLDTPICFLPFQSPYKVPRLVKGSVPSIFPWVESTEASELTPSQGNHIDAVRQPQLDSKSTNSIIAETDASPLQFTHQKVLNVHKKKVSPPIDFLDQSKQQTLANRLDSVTTAANSEEKASLPLTFNQLSAAEINLPFGWLFQKTVCEGTCLIILFTTKCTNINGIYKTVIQKAITVKYDLSIGITVLNNPVNIETFNLPHRITDMTQLRKLLQSVNELNVCKGCTSLSVDTQMEKDSSITVSRDISGMWRHHECSLLLSNLKACKFCRTTRKTITTKLRRWKTRQMNEKLNSDTVSPTRKRKLTRLRENLRLVKLSKAKLLGKCKSLGAKPQITLHESQH